MSGRESSARSRPWIRGATAAALAWSLLGGCAVRQMIYPAPPVTVPSPPPPPLEEVDLALADGTRVAAWHLPSAGLLEGSRTTAAEPPPALLFFHGNGENLGTMLQSGFFSQVAELGVAAVVVDYPGYGRSGGTPSEATLTAAADRAGEWLESRYPDRARFVAGWSLGAAVAIRQAADAPGRWHGLVALSPWTSLPELARGHFPGWLVGLALHESYDSIAAVRSLEIPSLLGHGSEDRIIPVGHGRRLAGELPGAVWIEVPGAGHNDLLARAEIWSGLSRFVDRVATRP